MAHSHELILEVIKHDRLSGKEIAKMTGFSYSGIRGRITELQKKGYQIKKDGNKYYIDNMKKNTPFIIKKDETGIILTLPIDNISDVSIEQIETFEKISKDFIKNLKSLLIKIKNNKKKKDKMKDVLLNWDIGDLIHKYLLKMDERGFHISNYSLFKTLEQYVVGNNRYRYRYWSDRLRFREIFPNKKDLNPIGYNLYNEIRVCKTPEQRKQLENFINDRLDKTGKIPTIDEIRNKRHESVWF